MHHHPRRHLGLTFNRCPLITVCFKVIWYLQLLLLLLFPVISALAVLNSNNSNQIAGTSYYNHLLASNDGKRKHDQFGIFRSAAVSLDDVSDGRRFLSRQAAGIIISKNRPCPHSECASTKRQRHRSRFFDRLFADYDKRLFPSNNQSVTVVASIFVNSLDSLSDVSFDFELGLFLRLTWNDRRLAFDPALVDGEETCDMATALHGQIWLPDLYITNEKKAGFHAVTANRLIKFDYVGKVFYSSRIYATIHCQMELHTFPFDYQTCDIVLESYAYTEKDISLEWAGEPLEMPRNMLIPQFSIRKIEFQKLTRLSSHGNVSSLVVTFHFVRDVGFYLLQIYVPSCLIVFTGFTAFWIDPAAVPARVTISVFTTLIIANMNFSLRKQLPTVSYIKAIDVWILACTLFVFLALIEYCICNVLLRQKAKGVYLMSYFGATFQKIPATLSLDREGSFRRAQTPSSLVSPTAINGDFSIAAENSENIREMPKLSTRLRRHAISRSRNEMASSASSLHQLSTNLHPPVGVRFSHCVDESDAEPMMTATGDKEDEEEEEDDEDADSVEPESFSCYKCCRLLCTGQFWARFTQMTGRERCDLVESACRRIFPISFLIFNAIYWFIYCYVLQP